MSTYNREQENLDRDIKNALKTDKHPSIALNNVLTQSLHERERKLNLENERWQLSLWYIPMILNTLVFMSLGIISIFFVENNIALNIVFALCTYMIIAGIGLTMVGIKLGKLKGRLTVTLVKRGTSYEVFNRK